MGNLNKFTTAEQAGKAKQALVNNVNKLLQNSIWTNAFS